MATEVVQTLLGRSPCSISGVVLPNHSRHPVKGHVYPAVLPTTTSLEKEESNRGVDGNRSVEGLLLLDLSPLEMEMFDYFEDEGIDYIRQRVEVHVPQSSIANVDTSVTERNFEFSKSPIINGYVVETNAYIWARGEGTLDTTKTWDYEAFRKEFLGWYLDSTVKPCRKDFEKK